MSVFRSRIASMTTSKAEAVGRLCNRLARDMTERGWSRNKRVLPAPSHSPPRVRWACRQEMTNKLPTPSLHCYSGTSRTRTNPKQNACVYLQNKVSTHVYINKFIDWVKFVPSDSLVIWIKGATLENAFTNTRAGYWMYSFSFPLFLVLNGHELSMMSS
jgi:hypothetical protein